MSVTAPEEPQLQCGAERRFAVLHGARHSWDLGYRSELTATQRLCSNFTYIPSISRPGEEPTPWPCHSGYLQDLWTAKVIDAEWGFAVSPENTRVFVCGNPGLIDTMSGVLQAEGFREHTRKTPGQIHVERYW